MNKILRDDELSVIYYEHNQNRDSSWEYERAIEAAIVTKIGNPLLSDYVEKAIMDDRKKWCKLIGEPFLIVADLQGFPLSLYKLPDQLTKELK